MHRAARILLGTLVLVAARAPLAQEMSAEEFESSLSYRSGDVVLKDGLATLRLGTDFRYLDPSDAEKVLVAWGNPGGSETLGMIVPGGVSVVGDDGWAVVVQYEEEGYVSDKDAAKIDYDDLLRDLKKQSSAANAERAKQGFPAIEIVGWAEPPRYDATSHKLYWAKDLRFAGASSDTLNYNIRVLGRRGVLVLNAVASMDQLPAVRESMQQVLAATEFNAGHRYEDFTEGDQVAKYGLAALVGGAVAAKAGVFKGLLVALLAAKKLVIVALVAIGAFIGKVLRGRGGGAKPPSAPAPPPLPGVSGWGK